MRSCFVPWKRTLACAIALAAGGCTLFGEDDPPACEIGASTEIGIVFADQAGTVSPLDDLGEVPLVPAPQGGHVLLVGPRIKVATETCQVQVTASLRDPQTNIVIGLEQRPLQVRMRADGWSTPPDPAGLSDLANVAVCPTAAVTEVAGRPARLEVKVLDDTGAVSVTTSLMAVPTCGDSQYCLSECNTTN